MFQIKSPIGYSEEKECRKCKNLKELKAPRKTNFYDFCREGRWQTIVTWDYYQFESPDEIMLKVNQNLLPFKMVAANCPWYEKRVE